MCFYDDEICFGHKLFIGYPMFYHEVSYSFSVEVFDVTVTVVSFGNQSEKQSLLGKRERTAVG